MTRLKIVFGLLLFICSTGVSQNLIMKERLLFLGSSYSSTQNRSFINKKLMFYDGIDTLIINQKLPFNTHSKNIIYKGVYLNCLLNQGVIYSFKLKVTCLNNIPKEYNSYYRTNCLFGQDQCSKFREVKKNSKYIYRGNYEKYIDINNELFEVMEISSCK